MQRQKSYQTGQSVLYLVATPIGNLSELSPRAQEVLSTVDVIAAEDTRNTGVLLNHFGIKTKMITYHLFNEDHSAEGILDLLREGKNVAVVSDAGYPLVSDPGQTVVNLVTEEGYPVVVINGPCAALTALVGSGLTVQPFTFYGFLSAKQNERKKQLESLKTREETLIFYEAPHRIGKMLADLEDIFGDRQICLARELTKVHEEYIRGRISEVRTVVDELKGEMVVVVSGYDKDDQPILSMQDLINVVDQYIETGMSASDAIREAAKKYGVSKNEIYRNYHN